MTVGEIINAIEKGGYSNDEWLNLKEKVEKSIPYLSKEDIELLEISEVMESLLMVCSAIEE